MSSQIANRSVKPTRLRRAAYFRSLETVQSSTGFPYNQAMQTVVEHPTFQRQAASIWTEGERHAFIDWIAANPLAGDVIPGAEGARKVRWAVQGKGKRGGHG